MHLALRGLAALAVAATASTLAVGVAEAAPTGRVVAATQKMTGPSLKTTQVGTYPAGARVTLQCYERGQSVKGALSKYHPNGGWDDLWYKTSDGVYVADIDIETGSNNPVTGKCGDAPAAQPAPVQGAAPAGLAATAGWQRPVGGRITQGFGGAHTGVDIAAPTGTAVVAANDGVVQFAGDGRNNSWMTAIAGNCILVRHSSVITGYAHLSRIAVSNGQRVSKGQVIGYVGATGKATGPHLHFEAFPLAPNFRNGLAGRINPAPYGGA